MARTFLKVLQTPSRVVQFVRLIVNLLVPLVLLALVSPASPIAPLRWLMPRQLTIVGIALPPLTGLLIVWIAGQLMAHLLFRSWSLLLVPQLLKRLILGPIIIAVFVWVLNMTTPPLVSVVAPPGILQDLKAVGMAFEVVLFGWAFFLLRI